MSAIPGAFTKSLKCACCNNPWNQETSSDAIIIGSKDLSLCNPCLQDNKGYDGIDIKNFDFSLSANENFYLWSNGGWKTANPIPLEYSSWNTFIALRDLNLDRLMLLLNELDDKNKDNTTVTNDSDMKLANYYHSFMDEETIEKQGIDVMSDIFKLCKHAKNDITKVVATLHSSYGVNVFFGMYSSPDKSNSEHTLCNLTQSGIGLPDRDYYFDADKEEKRSKYITYIASLLQLVGLHSTDVDHNRFKDLVTCQLIAKHIFAYESKIAFTHLTRTISRDPLVTYNKMKVNDLIKQSKINITWPQYLTIGLQCKIDFNWIDYFNYIGKSIDDLGDINVSAVNAIGAIKGLVNDTEYLEEYLLFHSVNSYADHLPNVFSDLKFEFYEKELKGTVQQLPRWKRALQGLESALGEELGQLYVSKYFPPDSKKRALEIVESVRDALRERLIEVDWMNEKTKEEAMLKMEKFKVKIGFPDKWIDYSNLTINKGQHFQNVVASRNFSFQLDLNRMNVPTDKSRWYMTPQTVNAYYHPSLNEIVFPAAILQAPFFDPKADAAVQYGSLGAVVGHEMTHGFDDQGRKYDSCGNLRDWWTGNDGEEYERRVKVMVQQAEKFEVFGYKLNGKLTCGENIADLGGVKLALRALKQYLKTNPENMNTLINGFTPYQRLFLAWSQAWRENVKKERAIQLVTLDPHGPNELRCNGTLSNIPEFLEAFNIKEGDSMYVPIELQVDIW